MQPSELFALGLGLTPPWKIDDIEFIEGEVHIKVDFEKGAKFDEALKYDSVVPKLRHDSPYPGLSGTIGHTEIYCLKLRPSKIQSSTIHFITYLITHFMLF